MINPKEVYLIDLHDEEERKKLLEVLPSIRFNKIRKNVKFSERDFDGSYDTSRHPTEFDYVVCYDDEHFEWMRDSEVPERLRIKRSSENLRVLEFEERYKADVKRYADRITRLANENDWREPWVRKQYRNAVFALMNLMLDDGDEGEKHALFEILRAGAVAADPFIEHYGDEIGVGSGNFKRLPMSSGENWVGVASLNLPEIDDSTVLVVPEIALASGSSIITLMYLLHEEGKKPKRIDVYSVNSSHQGMAYLFEAAEEFDIPLRVVTATVCHRMNNHLYLLREPEYYVGDGGDLSQDDQKGKL